MAWHTGSRVLAVLLAVLVSAGGAAAQDGKDPKGGKAPSPAPGAKPVKDEDPALTPEQQQKHDAEVASLLKKLRSEKNKEMVESQIANLGAQKSRAGRDALFQYCRGNKNQEYLQHAFLALAKIGGTKVLEFLTGDEALTCNDFLTQQSAAMALGDTKDARAVAPLLATLEAKGTKIEVQGSCLISIGKCGKRDAGARDALLRYCGHKHDTVRANALEALGYLQSSEAVQILVEHLTTDKNTRCRGAAATGLGWTKLKDAVPHLQKAADEDDAFTVRDAAMKALKELGAVR
jgi:HEAT repeat protein